MYFSISLSGLVYKSFEITCDGVQFLKIFMKRFPAFDHWCNTSLFHHIILLNNYFLEHLWKAALEKILRKYPE